MSKTPEEHRQDAITIKELFIKGFDCEQCLDNMDDLVGETDLNDVDRVQYAISVTEDYFHLKGVEESLKKVDASWFLGILDDIEEFIRNRDSE